ncbi:hypothetical protein BDBG_16035 [Blastomyces gilchristii SLH14081]|uniref:Uncharacterized protein n=1 Tax=Blastomyces gilchristii (strain SLH14081) TaxID=559298 RepID=A0A179U6B8_BLAGS|nr:uncharacterized protein BDBG_16035 [Blastomyces gilchristii SLH14081]OAT03263.1 hypothetical protein BDBG_16035 [Blastomyces gilchristii SLH14081]
MTLKVTALIIESMLMTSIESVDDHDIEILTLCIENEALCMENAALKIKFRTITSLLQATQTVLENDI